jgi:TIR domain
MTAPGSDERSGERERPALSRARIFISYRRRETAGHAGRLYDGLVEHFGAERVFMDVKMEPGVDFAETIQEAVGSCGALVALIGEEWLTVTDAQGNRRIDDPADVHRLEIEAALDRGVRLIPVLVQDARMPTADELPDPLKTLVRRQAVELSDERWDYDVSRLVAVLERVLSARGGVSRVRRYLLRRRGRAGLLAGALAALLVVGTVAAATGQFEAPRLEISSFQYVPPKPDKSKARKCVVEVDSLYRVSGVRFVVDGQDGNTLQEQADKPYHCGNPGSNVWDTCTGHGPNWKLDDDVPHTLTAIVTDADGNTAEKTRTVDTNCPDPPE